MAVTDTDSIGTTVNFTITNSVVSQGDTLTIDTMDSASSASTINASGMSGPTPSAAYPQLINLVEEAGRGTDTLIASPTFNDTIELGTGNDTVYGGLGQETFVAASSTKGTNTLIENQNVDFGLFNNVLVMGTVLEDGGGSTSFEQYENNQYNSYLTESEWVNQIQLVNAVFPANGVGNYYAGGSVFSGGSVMEPIDNLFENVDLTGGVFNDTTPARNDTIVVNSPTGTINVGGSTYDVAPFGGSATLDSAANGAGGIEFYVINFAPNNSANINITDSGGTKGDKVVMANGTGQGDNFDLSATGGGGFRVGTVTDSVVSNMSLSFRGAGIVRLVLNTSGGNAAVVVNDTAVPTFIALGSGTDNVQVGTVPLIPDTANRTLEYPNGVPVVNTAAMTNGNSTDLFVMGGSGNDTMTVEHNSAMLYLHGGSGINVFVMETFLVLHNNPSNPSQITNLNTLIGGSGSNRYSYLQNAPVDIIGGTGYNTFVIVGTPIGETFVVGNNYVAGAGVYVTFTNIQSIEIDGGGGSATVYVMATSPSFSISVVGGGSGGNTINIGGDPPPLVFNPPPFTYTPPPVMVPQPPKLVTTTATQAFPTITFDVNAILYLALLATEGSEGAVVTQLLAPFLAAFGSNIPDFQLQSDTYNSSVSAVFYSFFLPFIFAPEVEITVSSLSITYQTQTYVAQPPIEIQPPPVTVTEPPFIFQATPNYNAAQIAGALTIDGGPSPSGNTNTVIFHDEDGTAGAGFLRLDTFPQLTGDGEVTPRGATSPEPVFIQNGTLTQTDLTLGGFGMGISPTTGVPAYPATPPVDFQGVTEPIYDGIEMTDVQNLELFLPSGGNTATIESVPSNLKLTIDPGAGTNTLDLEASGASTTIDAGAGTNSIVVGQNGQLNQILSTLTVDGTAHLTEQDVPQTGAAVGVSLLSNLPQVFVNTEPGNLFNGVTNGETLTFTPATSSTAATIARSAGSWTTDGFAAGDPIDVSGTGTANDGLYTIASISSNGLVLYLAAGSTLINQMNVPNVTVVNPQATDGSFVGNSQNNDELTFNPAANSNPATIVMSTGTWAQYGFTGGDRILVTGTGTNENDGNYVIALVNGSTLTLASGEQVKYQPAISGVSVIAFVVPSAPVPIVEPFSSSNPSGALELWAVVQNSSGAIIQDQVQELGSQEYGVQETNSSDQLLYYDAEGNPTTDSTITGIPVIEQVAQGTAGAMPVYFNSSNEEVFTNTGVPVYIANFTSGQPLYVNALGNLTTTMTSTPFLIPVNRNEVLPWTVRRSDPGHRAGHQHHHAR